MTFKQALIIAMIFGIVAGGVVWWLERFEVNKLHGEVIHYLKNQDEFKDFLRSRETNNE